jgi:hypothetical protein
VTQQLQTILFPIGKQVKAFPFVLSLSKDERETRVVASYRRSCFDKLSTNGLSGKQDL